uniref:Uncharacterized protein n=1 Tax=Rhizophora mucronata TaxID=61149 RepID=A0A2P2NCF3_RHIMU
MDADHCLAMRRALLGSRLLL